MRRILSLVLLAAFSLPLLAPLVALAQSASSDANLPMCCRRHGAHHCAMHMAGTNAAPAVAARCPMYPQPPTSPAIGNLLALTAEPPTQHATFAMLAPAARAEGSRRIARSRSRHKRGPPTKLL